MERKPKDRPFENLARPAPTSTPRVPRQTGTGTRRSGRRTPMCDTPLIGCAEGLARELQTLEALVAGGKRISGTDVERLLSHAQHLRSAAERAGRDTDAQAAGRAREARAMVTSAIETVDRISFAS